MLRIACCLLLALTASARATEPAANVAIQPPAAEPASAPVQSMLLRAVTVTYELDRSLQFYRDVLGQELVELRRLDTARSRAWLEIGPRAEVWFAVLRGSGEYAGGAVTGGRIAFIGIKDPDASPASRGIAAHHKGRQGDMILPHRVSNLAEIERRIAAGGYEVLTPAATSSTGLSRSTMVFDPNGRIVELFELSSPPASAPPRPAAAP